MNGTELDTKRINYGISILKVWLSFVVITCHFYEGTGIVAYPMKVAVPCFIAISFFFVEASFLRSGNTIRGDKIARLLIPGIIWGIVYYIASLWMKMGPTFKDLLYQLLLGGNHLINPTLWYLYDTAIILLLFLVLQKTSKRSYTLLRISLIVFCMFLQYSGINYNLFSKLPFDVRYSIGRLVEMIPASCAGSLLFDVFQCKKISAALSIGYGIPALTIGNVLYWLSYYLPKPEIPGFGYQGLVILIGALLLLAGFYGLKITSKLVLPVYLMQQYGLGIYCIHMAVGKMMKLLGPKFGFATGNLVFCFIVWIICFASCLVIDKFTNKKARFLIS